MSIATQIARLQADRDTIRTKLISWDLAESTDTLTTLATTISGIPTRTGTTTLTTSNTSVTLSAGYYDGTGVVNIVPETKTGIVPTTNGVTVTPTSGKVLESVVIDPIPNQQSTISQVLDATHDANGNYTNTSKTIPIGYYSSAGSVSIDIAEPTFTPTTATSAGTDSYYPDSGKVYGKVTINKVLTQTKAAVLHEVSGSTTSDSITPDSGYLLSSVTVPRIPVEVTEVTAGTVTKIESPTLGKYSNSIMVQPTPTEAGSASVLNWVDGDTVSDIYTPSTGKFFSSFTVPRISNDYQDVSGVTATAAQVLDDYYFVTSSGTLTEGTMVNRGAVDETLTTTSAS